MAYSRRAREGNKVGKCTLFYNVPMSAITALINSCGLITSHRAASPNTVTLEIKFPTKTFLRDSLNPYQYLLSDHDYKNLLI
jgi:hypothetical protein